MNKLYSPGSFGLLDTDALPRKTAWIYDGGLECRQGGDYVYDNSRRPGYHGYLLQYSLEGCGEYLRDGVCHRLPPQTGFLVRFPERSIYRLPPGSAQPWTFIYLHFDGSALLPYIERLEELTGGVFALPPSAPCIRSLLTLQSRMCSGEKLPKYENGSFVFHFVCTLLRDIENNREAGNASLLKRAVQQMEQSFRDLESMQALAGSLGISHEHLCRLFRQEMHLSPGQYWTQLKVQAAMYELLNTPDNLNVIAERCGFSNANYFGKVFKKKTGVTPIQYRNME